MEDSRIVALFYARDERALSEVQEKYGAYCLKIALHILDNLQDAEECVNDTLLRAWESIPPANPRLLGAYLGKLARNISLDRYKAAHAAKREASLYVLSLDELAEYLPAGDATSPVPPADAAELGAAINRFLKGQRAEVRNVFILRYFHGDPVESIARRRGMSESKVKSMLHRTRGKLRKYLESEGISI